MPQIMCALHFNIVVFADDRRRGVECEQGGCFYFEELHISEYAYWSMSCNFHI